MNSFAENKIVLGDLENISSQIKDFHTKIEGKTFLITGGAGFLGKYLVAILEYLNVKHLNNPCKIIILDNFITGLRGVIQESDRVKVIEQDISKDFTIEEDIDFIFHAASIAAPVFYNKYRLETIDVGFIGTKKMLEIAREKNVESFMFFSTSEVYGNPDSKFIPTPETYFGNVSCIGPRASYDEPKRIGETLCITYAEMFNMPVKIVRPFNVYGPGMRLDDGRGAINFVVSALKGEKIPVYGDGRNTRTWTYITDAIVGFFLVLFSNHNKEAFNIGSDQQEIEMRHLAEIVSGLIEGREVEIHNIAGPNEAYTKADVNRRAPDLTKVRTMVGFSPKINLVSGLKRFISWVEDELLEQEHPTGLQRHCRICGNENLQSVISLGESPLANNLLSENELSKKEEKYPLEMVFCDNCKLNQLSYVVPQELMFSDYLYVTSTTETFKQHFLEMSNHLTKKFNLRENSLVVDIGSNDGLLLKGFRDRGVRIVGVDPAENICKLARENGIDTLTGFFDIEIAKSIVGIKGNADLVTANNVFAHVGNISKFTENVKKLLKNEGVFVIEVQYLLDIIQKLTFDNIYHEHVSYFTVISLNEFFKRNNMEIFDVEHVVTHGGSIRVYTQKSGGSKMIENSVNEFINREKMLGLDKLETFQKFGDEVKQVKEKFRETLEKIKGEGKRVMGYGAPAKATTLLNFYGIDNKIIDFIVEDNELKHFKTLPGVRIPIKSRESLSNNPPEYMLILAWNFAEEIMKKNEAYKQMGGKFLVPSPDLRVY
jgi:nucleoside-diphosphate-sugar epimerase/SAM-dependent methyltransferase